MRWHEPSGSPFRLTGFPWHKQDAVYRRLPIRPSGELPAAVNELANCTAGGQVAFRSDSRRVAIRVQLAGRANMNHMPATGQCGFDLYVGPPLAQRFHRVAKYDIAQSAYELLLFEHPDAVERNFTLNFPLYQGVKQLQIGLAPEAHIAPPFPWADGGRIVIYGTSVTQGGCASRPGMAYTNILSRALNMEVINLGFSGNGQAQPEVIRLVADVPSPRLLALDYEANCEDRLADTLPEALRILRDRHRDIPILVVSRIAFSTDLTHGERLRAREANRELQANLVGGLKRGGDSHIHFLDGSVLLGSDFDECTVDGVHPNDLGFMRMARSLETTIRAIIRSEHFS